MYHMVQNIDVTVTAQAEPAEVYALLISGARWPEFSRLGSFELERPGDDGAEGVGAIRVFRTRVGGRTYTSREEIVERVADRRFSYRLLSGLAIRDYRVDVDLTPVPDGTEIHWHASFTPKIPGTGALYRRQLTGLAGNLLTGLAATAGGVRNGA